MKDLRVETASGVYPIAIRKDFNDLAAMVKNAVKGGSALIVSDSNVAPVYAAEIEQKLKGVFESIHVYAFEAGEKRKNLDTIRDIYSFMLEKHMDRGSCVIGLGGGVCGDMAGFAAATFMRGIDFIQIPTTLLAQVDSSVGGKVGVDFNGVKNIIGAFYQPKLVYTDIDTLLTLPEREIAAGLAEVIKYGIISSRELYDYISENKDAVKNGDRDTVAKIIESCCLIKAAVVKEDEKESGLREILNFGHTIGHAIESLKGFELLHGECVAIGMAAAMKISCDKGFVSEGEAADLEDLLRYFNLPIRVSGLDEDNVYNTLFSDKKVRNNVISFVLAEKVGKAMRTKSLTEKEIRAGIKYVLE